MRQRRYKLEMVNAFYHLFSRVVDRSFKLTAEVKDEFRKIIYEVAVFCGAEVVAYALMDNHIHILAMMPPKFTFVTDDEVIRRVKVRYGASEARRLENKLAKLTKEGRANEIDDLLFPYRRRMNDLSEFMRSIKERMTIYYNENNNREGTLWESRFGSTLVEHAPGVQLLKNFAAYIDLNPVRVKIVDDPQHYNWSSCGDPLFEKGLEHLFPEAEEGDRPGLYVQFLRDRARRKGYVKKKAQGEPDLFDVLSKNDVMTRSRAIGSPAFIAAVAGHRPPGGLTTFSSAADVPFIAVGQLKRRKNRIS